MAVTWKDLLETHMPLKLSDLVGTLVQHFARKWQTCFKDHTSSLSASLPTNRNERICFYYIQTQAAILSIVFACHPLYLSLKIDEIIGCSDIEMIHFWVTCFQLEYIVVPWGHEAVHWPAIPLQCSGRIPHLPIQTSKQLLLLHLLVLFHFLLHN